MKQDNKDRLVYEKEFLKMGYRFICGTDEVGRGCLAGPLVVCSIIMPLNEEDIIEGVKDSKKLSEKKREELSKKIIEKAISYQIIQITPEEIDKINILQATKKAMKMSIDSLEIKPDICLLDAVELNLDYKTKSIIKGDDLSYSIACASIVAKVFRDNLISKIEGGELYNFKKNKGYGTKEHIDAIKKYGIISSHRKTFTKKFINQ